MSPVTYIASKSLNNIKLACTLGVPSLILGWVTSYADFPPVSQSLSQYHVGNKVHLQLKVAKMHLLSVVLLSVHLSMCMEHHENR
jgi:hypothetical protein